jgi:DNA-binding NarL/FixJ family response regulator
MPAANKIRVLAIDDHPILLSGIAAVLGGEEDIELVAEARDGKEAIEAFRNYLPDVTLVDLQMPGMSGIDTMLAIRSEFPDSRFIVLTTYRGDRHAVRSLKAGAMAYLLKHMLRRELVDTVRIVHAGGRRIPAEIAAEMAEHALDDTLSDREVDVLRRVAMGASNKVIAAQLAVSEATIKSHLSNILSKLHAHDRTHAVTIATRRGYIDA